MKKIVFPIFFVFTLSFNMAFLKADCDVTEWDAENVYDEVIWVDTDEETNVKINVGNVTENVYLVVLNDYDDSKATYHYKDINDDGFISFNTLDIFSNINYTIQVYSEDKTCGSEPLKTIKVKTPKFNEHSNSDICNEYYESEMCGTFYDTGDMTLEEFNQKVLEEAQEEIVNNMTFLDYVKKYYLFVLIPIIIVIIVFVVRIIILKRGKKND